MTEPVEFKSFEKIPRLRASLQTVITEKIDGTNAQVYVPEDPNESLLVGSRNRWITPGKGTDNFGFAQWVSERVDELRAGLGPGRHYGEWWGAGVGRRYDMTEKRWSLFNVQRWAPGRDTPPACCSVVPVLYAGEFTPECVREVTERLQREGSVAAPGFMKPEGIVVYLAGKLSKFTFDGDGHKGTEKASPEES